MSMYKNQSPSSLSALPPTADQSRRPNAWLASSLARYVRQHRQDLDMTVARAAELSGLALSEWYALEAGWVPEDRQVQHAIAGALESDISNIAILASIAINHQCRC